MPRQLPAFDQTVAGFRITLAQDVKRANRGLDFTVTYGEQSWPNLDYGMAAVRLGQALMHALACEGKLDPR